MDDVDYVDDLEEVEDVLQRYKRADGQPVEPARREHPSIHFLTSIAFEAVF